MRFVSWSDVPCDRDTSALGRRERVYALIDPRDETVRYVGITRERLRRRWLRHMANPTNKLTSEWFEELSALGLLPEIRLVEFVSSRREERRWIFWFRKRGDLLNGYVGI